MTQTAVGVAREISEAAQRAARKLTRFQRGGLDVLAHDGQDYQLIFLEEAWRADGKFQKNGQQGEATRYCCKAIWNHHATLQKIRRTHERGNPMVTLSVPLEQLEVDTELDVEAAQHARDCLELLRRELDADDWELLEKVALSGGSTTDAYEPQTDGLPNSFYRRVTRLREKARALLPDWEE